MKKKTGFLFAGASTLSVTAGALSLALAFSPRGFLTFSTDNVVWNHYTAVAAGLEQRGVKEYWVSCDDHSHQFTAPLSANIVNKGAPEQSFIDSLASDDDRLIPAYQRYYDFEDGVLPSFITPNQNVSGVTASNGRVEVSVTANDYGVNIGKEYLDIVFADPNVTAIAFDAFSPDEATSNFRHRHNGTNTTYEGNSDSGGTTVGYGLVTGGYKTFYFTRAMYNQWVDGTYVDGNGDCVIWGGGSVGIKKVYIDNLRVASRNATTVGLLDFDSGAFTDKTNFRYPDASAVFACKNKDTSDQNDFSYELKTSGTRSIHVNKDTSNWASFTINQNGSFFKNVPEEGFLVDFRATAPYNHTNGIRNGQSSDNTPWASSTTSLVANKWYTYVIKPSDINSGGRFMQIAASTTADLYMDSLRYATGSTYGFEGACVQQYGAYVTVAGQQFEPSESGDLRDSTLCYKLIFNNGETMVTYAGLDREHVTEGAQALKVTFEHTGYNMIHFEPYLIDALDATDSISIDVYSDGATFASGTLFEDVTPGQWTTVTFSKNQLSTSSAYARSASKVYRTQANIAHVGSLWFDNIRTTNID